MAEQTLTKKQFQRNIACAIIFAVFGIIWLAYGITQKNIIFLIIGVIVPIFNIVWIAQMLVRRKRQPIEDTKPDK